MLHTSSSGSTRVLIDQISGDIKQHALSPGQLIGTQSDLCDRYQVSPSVFFQATRILMDRGVVELRQGSGGGLFVADNRLAQCGQRLAKYFECIGLTFDDCTAVNQMLQELCMRLATGQLDLPAVDRLRDVQKSLRTAGHYQASYLMSRISQEFAEGTGNVVLALLYRSITDVLLDFGVDEQDSAPEVPQAMLVDLSIVMSEAVIAGRHEAAAALYAQFRDALLRKHAFEARYRKGGVRKHMSLHEGARRALPNRLATLILQDITSSGLADGHHLGKEEELLGRYGVSRATFRQAIALLQEYSIVETKRGPSGGLIVRTPDFAVVGETTLDMMIRRGASQGDAQVVWEALMLLALDRALEQSPEVVAIAAAKAAKGEGDPVNAVGMLAEQLIDGAALRVLSIYAQLVTELSRRLAPRQLHLDKTVVREFLVEMALSLTDGDHGRARVAWRSCLAHTGIVLTA